MSDKKDEVKEKGFVGYIGGNDQIKIQSGAETMEKAVFGTSNQKIPEGFMQINELGAVIPTINRDVLASMITFDETHAACLSLKAMCIAGHGYDFMADKNDPRMKKVIEWAKMPSDRFGYTLKNLLFDIARDYVVYNDFFIEVVSSSRNPKLYRVDPKTMYVIPRRNKDNIPMVGSVKGYVQATRYDRSKISTTEYDPYMGKTSNRITHSILRGGLTAQTDNYYGVPAYIPIFKYIVENGYISDFNTGFFKNGAKLSYGVIMTGADMTNKQRDDLKNYLSSDLTGLVNMHKLLLLIAPEMGAKIDLKEMSKGYDGSFMDLRLSNRSAIAIGHLTPLKLVGESGKANLGGGSEDISAMKKYQEVVVRPDMTLIEDYINAFIEEEFGIDPMLRFKNISIINDKDQAIIDKMYFGMVDEFGNRANTIEEVRKEAGFEKLNYKDEIIDPMFLTIEEKEKLGILNSSNYEPADAKDNTISDADISVGETGSIKYGNNNMNEDDHNIENIAE